MQHKADRAHIDRRGFLQRAGTLVVGGLTASAVIERVAPNVSSAQQTPKRPQRVAVVGVGHYHAFSPPNYLRILDAGEG